VFSLVGNVNSVGLIEIPMGLTLREIIFDIGGGIPKGRKFKAVQTGGPSGGCLPETALDMPVDFDTLTEAGSMMGSGGMIVMDDHTCMVDVARYFFDFLADESCGKCLPCREGLRQMSKILTRIQAGEGKESDIEVLESLSEAMVNTCLCALGNSAPNPVLSTLKYFKDEYYTHIRDRKCPGGVCKALVTYSIDQGNCNGCHLCFGACPAGCISGEAKKPHFIDQATCIKCNSCFEVCRQNAVQRQ
jgi:NADH-quinone oxidoreductase subunit F